MKRKCRLLSNADNEISVIMDSRSIRMSMNHIVDPLFVDCSYDVYK